MKSAYGTTREQSRGFAHWYPNARSCTAAGVSMCLYCWLQRESCAAVTFVILYSWRQRAIVRTAVSACLSICCIISTSMLFIPFFHFADLRTSAVYEREEQQTSVVSEPPDM